MTPQEHWILTQAVARLRPGAEFNIRDGVIEWTDQNQTQPTDADIAGAIALITVLDARKAAYAFYGDQLDNFTKVLKHLQANGTDIGPDGEAQIAMSDAVKSQNPKPS